MANRLNLDRIVALLDASVTSPTISGPTGCARRVGVTPQTVFNWLVRSRLGDEKLQSIVWHDVTAPFHVHLTQNAHALTALAIEQSAMDRALNGCEVPVFFQGQRQYEKVLKPQFADCDADDLEIIFGPDTSDAYEMKPTMQHLKPSDALTLKMLEAHSKRYQPHQTISVGYSGVLRLERPDEATKTVEHQAEVFEEQPADGQRPAQLALARPAKDAAEMDKWEAQGDFKPAPVAFVNAKGERTELRADLEERLQALKERGPEHPQPEAQVEVGQPDTQPQAVTPPPPPFDLRQHPRAYLAPSLQKPTPAPAYAKSTSVGDGVERTGIGPDPSMVGRHQGFSVAADRPKSYAERVAGTVQLTPSGVIRR